jgi:uncharacterized damage-inducible protein DinB
LIRFTAPALLCLALASSAHSQSRAAWQDDLWREYDLYRGRLFELARSIPAEKYDWRPGEGARSIGEVILHVGLNNYMLLDLMGRAVPQDLYSDVPAAAGRERQRALFQKNMQFEKQLRDKQKIIEMAQRAFAAGAEPLRDTSAAGLDKPAMFGDRNTTMGGLQLRSVAHLHEHLGQLIAYARSVGVVPPWSQ